MNDRRSAPEFVKLVQDHPEMDMDDLRLALSSQLELFTNIWIFGVTVVLVVLGLAFQLSNEGFSLVTKLGLVLVAALLYVVLITRGRDPEKRLETILNESDYFEAKEIVRKRESLPTRAT